jgi:hypothetical protein
MNGLKKLSHHFFKKKQSKMPSYTVTFNDGLSNKQVGTFTDFKDAYKAAITPEMREENAHNRWHIMMYDYAKNSIATDNQLRIAYQEPTPNPEDDVCTVFITANYNRVTTQSCQSE